MRINGNESKVRVHRTISDVVQLCAFRKKNAMGCASVIFFFFFAPTNKVNAYCIGQSQIRISYPSFSPQPTTAID